MQDLPEKTTLLEAMAKFLGGDVLKLIPDPAIAFRVRIAAHLAGVVARELRAEEAHDAAELERLRALFGVAGEVPAAREARTAELRALNGRLAQALRAGTIDRARAHAHLKTTLLEKLAVNQPRFDTRLDID